MNDGEIRAMRDVLAEFGFEHIPSEVAAADYMGKLELVKERFKRIQPHIEELKNKLDFGIIDLSEMAVELGHRFGTECTEDQCRHFLLMNRVFQYEEA